MNKTEMQIQLQNELAVLVGSRARLRDLWLENNSSHLLEAITKIGDRIREAEGELDATIESQVLSQIVPVMALSTRRVRF